jgi:hypothetical protein
MVPLKSKSVQKMAATAREPLGRVGKSPSGYVYRVMGEILLEAPLLSSGLPFYPSLVLSGVALQFGGEI